MTRHNQIYPNDEELQAVQKLVQVVEASLRKVSEKIHEEEMVVFTAATLQYVYTTLLVFQKSPVGCAVGAR